MTYTALTLAIARMRFWTKIARISLWVSHAANDLGEFAMSRGLLALETAERRKR